MYSPTSTVTASRSASKTASVTSPRSSPSAWSGSGPSQHDAHAVDVVERRSRPSRPLGRGRASATERQPRAPARRPLGAATSSPSSNRARGENCNGTGPAYVNDRVVGDERERRPAVAFDLQPRARTRRAGAGRRSARRRGRRAAPARRRLAAGRGRARRTASESTPIPRGEPANRRPFTRPSEIVRSLARRRAPPGRAARRAPRENVRVAAGDDPERLAGREPVQHLVDEAVAAEGEDRVARRPRAPARSRGPPLGEQRSRRRRARRARRSTRDARRHAAGERIDDQRRRASAEPYAGVE